YLIRSTSRSCTPATTRWSKSMLHNLHTLIGQGARRLCPVCRCAIAIKPVGRTRTYCSDRCRQVGHRSGEFRDKNPDLSGGPYPGEGLTRNPDFSPTKSMACKATFARRGSPANGPLAVVGRGISTAGLSLTSAGQASLIRRAVATELAARWSRRGLR